MHQPLRQPTTPRPGMRPRTGRAIVREASGGLGGGNADAIGGAGSEA